MSATMSEQERQEFLASVHIGVFAVQRHGRAPLAVPIWYGYQPGGPVKILLSPDSLKAKLLAEAGRFSLCVQSEKLPYKYVMVEGSVIETRQCDIEGDARPMAHRYLGPEAGDEYVGDGTDASMICVEMQPEVWYSVDYGKAG